MNFSGNKKTDATVNEAVSDSTTNVPQIKFL